MTCNNIWFFLTNIEYDLRVISKIASKRIDPIFVNQLMKMMEAVFLDIFLVMPKIL